MARRKVESSRGPGLPLGRRRYKEGRGIPQHDRSRSSDWSISCRMSLE
jgi:hypothetical protein